jgi:hypothetical protein
MFNRFALPVIGAAILASSLPALAVKVTVNGADYDVTYIDGTYADHKPLFQWPPSGLMPWWGDGSGALASQFAFQVYDGLGSGSFAGSGPMFAFAYDAGSSSLEGAIQSITDPNTQDIQTASPTDPIKYAVINPTATPVPAPLPLLGGLLAYRLARKLRVRQSR